jgi:release factor glutamine methyltransferase
MSSSAGSPDASGTVSWRDLHAEAWLRIESALGGNRRQEAQWIVERVSGATAAQLSRIFDEPVGVRSVAFFDSIVSRRCEGEPLQYCLGVWAFRELDLVVDKRVLIPRPETELVAQVAIDHLRTYDRPVIAVDLGTGSGAIGLSMAFEVPRSTVHLVDISSDALVVAQANVAGLGSAGARVSTHLGSWYEALPPTLLGSVDVIVANPPYIADTDELDDVVRQWEPHLALFSADDGTADLGAIIDGARPWLAPGGMLVAEHGAAQGSWAVARCVGAGFRQVRSQSDLLGRDRAVIASAR